MPRAPRVLVVEDAEAIQVAVVSALADAGHVVRGRSDGSALEQELAEFDPDVVVLDIMLPGRDGFTLLPVVRAHGGAAVILLTARGGVPDRVRGLRAGADDYVVKPFSVAELLARVEAVLRRAGHIDAAIEVGDLVVDLAAGRALRGGQELRLTATELRLLDQLARHRGRVLSKGQLLGAVWGWEDYDLNVVEVHISALRRKLGEPTPIHTARGLGYVLREPDPSSPAAP